MLPQRCRTLIVHRVCDSAPGSSVRGRRTAVVVCQIPNTTGPFSRSGTDLVRESVDGLWGWSRDLFIKERSDFFTTRFAIFFGSKRCELYRFGVEIHQESLKPAMVSTVLKRFPTRTHVTNAMSGILTTFPFSTCSSYSSQIIFLSSPGTANGSEEQAFDLAFCLGGATFSSSSSSRSLSDKWP